MNLDGSSSITAGAECCVSFASPTKSADQVHPDGCEKNDSVAYIDAIGNLDGTRCLLEWKTSSSRNAEKREGLLSLIRNWSATPGSQALRRSSKSLLSASA